jgi:hypothetical protein
VANEDLILGTVTTWPNTATGSFDVQVADLPGLREADGGTACGSAAIEKEHKVCGAFKANSGFPLATCGSGDFVTKIATSPKIIFDAVPPPKPSIVQVDSLDRALRVEVEPGIGAAVIRLEFRLRDTPGDFVAGPTVTTESKSGRIEDLTNDVVYEVRAVALDEAGNESEPSDVVTATPVLTYGFFARYQAAGGAEQGGCDATGGASFAVLGAVLGLVRLLGRRNR